MGNREKQDHKRLGLFLALAVSLGLIYLAWGQYNSASALFQVGFLRYYVDEPLAADPSYALTEEEQLLYDAALEAGRAWAEANPVSSGSFETLSAARWFGEPVRVTLSYRLYDQGQDKTVILLHGFQGSGEECQAWAPYWWEQGYNVLIPTQRGYSVSGNENYEPTTYGVYEQFDLYDLIFALGLENETVVVHGRGNGAAAAIYMASNPELAGAGLDALVAEGIYDSLGALRQEQMKRHFKLGEYFSGKFLRYQVRKNLGFDPDSADLAAAAANLETPVLFVCGRDETFLGPEKTRNVYEACSAEKYLEELPEVSFRMLWAGAGEAYRSSATAFLANAGLA